MAIDVHIPLGLVSNYEHDKFKSTPVIRQIAGSYTEALARRMRFYAGDPCPKNHFIRDLITGTKQPFSIRYKRTNRCALCEFQKRSHMRPYTKKEKPLPRAPYSEIKNKDHR